MAKQLDKICLVILWGLFSACNASHFRGGTASWKHLRSVGYTHEIALSFRLGWRRDSSTACDDNTIANKQAGYHNGNWNIQQGDQSYVFENYDSSVYPVPTGVRGSNFPVSTGTICTTYDSVENWAYGYNNVKTNVTTARPFTIEFSGGNWISNLRFGSSGSWSVALIDIDLGTRSDTGLVNRPPTTFSTPIVRLQLGCLETIQIRTIDQDNDILTCRYAVGNTECAGICGQYEHFTLNSQNCTITYDGAGGLYTIPVALMILDSPRQSITVGGRSFSPSDYLSKIPLQFLVKVETTSGCNVVPTYPVYAIPEDKLFTIPEEGSLNEILYAQPSSLLVAITRFIILGPLGLQSSPIYSSQNGVYATNVSWSPTPDQAGSHRICYYAVDGANKNGKQRCFEVSVKAIANPCEVDNGGCNDLCVPSGLVSACACSKPCWSLATDRKTCIPFMEVTCTGDNIDIAVAKCSTNKTVVAGSSVSAFSRTACKSVDQGSDFVLSFNPLECDVVIQSNPIEVQYIVNIWIWEGETYGQGQSTVTRGEWQNIPASCSLDSSTNITGSFVPIPPLNDEYVPENVVIEGLGSFTLYFEFYRGSNFSSAYGPLDFPLEVTVNDDVFFSLGAVGRGGLIFFTEECVAQSAPTLSSDTLQYTFIKNGCFLDSTTIKYDSPDPMENRFSTKVFEFENRLVVDRQDADIYIQCKVMLCDATENNTRCSQLCLPGPSFRRKRSVEEEEETLEKPSLSESPSQKITGRFRVLIHSDQDEVINYEGDNHNKASSNHYNSIFSGVFAILFCAFWQ